MSVPLLSHPKGRAKGGSGKTERLAQSATRVWGLFSFSKEVLCCTFWVRGFNLRTRSSWNPGLAISNRCSIFVPASSSVALGSGGKADPEDYFEN